MDGEKEIIDVSKEGVIKEKLNDIILKSGVKKRIRFIMGALGSIPWVGGIIAASASAHAEKEQGKTNELFRLWLEEHKEKFYELASDILYITQRLDGLGEDLQTRIESDEYMVLVRKAFKSWDEAGTKEKRNYIKNLIVNAATTSLCVDDLVRLFNDWLDLYHEAHFKVIREIHQHHEITRGKIWDNINPSRPQENSAEADLFKMLIRDLNMGGVIRQKRETNMQGQFIKPQRSSPRSAHSDTYESAFENTKPYVLTELGQQFVHYTMTEAVKRIADNQNAKT